MQHLASVFLPNDIFLDGRDDLYVSEYVPFKVKTLMDIAQEINNINPKKPFELNEIYSGLIKELPKKVIPKLFTYYLVQIENYFKLS